MSDLIKDMKPEEALRALAKLAKKSGNQTMVWTYFRKFRDLKRKARLREQRA